MMTTKMLSSRYCDACGNHGLEEREDLGPGVLECSLCGQLAGDDVEVNRILLRREARDRGMGEESFQLVVELNALPGVAVRRASDGDPFEGTWPRIEMECDRRGVRQLGYLLRSLTLHKRELRFPWTLTLGLHDGLRYVLGPDFQASPTHVSPGMIEDACADLQRLTDFVAADMRLSWWRDRS